MKENYKYEFFKYLCSKLNIEAIEKKFSDYGIIPSENDNLCSELSKYFYLANNVNEEKLSDEMKEKYVFYFSRSAKEIFDQSLTEELHVFLEKSYKDLLFPDIQENFCFYGPLNYKYVAPRDSIVLGFCYKEFDIDENNFDEIYYEREKIVCNMLNYIQETLSEEIGIKISVIKYNEFIKLAEYRLV